MDAILGSLHPMAMGAPGGISDSCDWCRGVNSRDAIAAVHESDRRKRKRPTTTDRKPSRCSPARVRIRFGLGFPFVEQGSTAGTHESVKVYGELRATACSTIVGPSSMYLSL